MELFSRLHIDSGDYQKPAAESIRDKLTAEQYRVTQESGTERNQEPAPVGEVFKKVSRRNTKCLVKNVITNSAEYGLIPQRDFFDKDIAVDGNTANYYIIEEGDFVYNPRKSNTAPYGPFNRYNLSERGIISPLYTCLVLQADINPSYLAWYFSLPFIKRRRSSQTSFTIKICHC